MFCKWPSVNGHSQQVDIGYGTEFVFGNPICLYAQADLIGDGDVCKSEGLPGSEMCVSNNTLNNTPSDTRLQSACSLGLYSGVHASHMAFHSHRLDNKIVL